MVPVKELPATALNPLVNVILPPDLYVKFAPGVIT